MIHESFRSSFRIELGHGHFFGGKAERQSQMSVVVYPNDTRRSRRFSGIIMYVVLLFLQVEWYEVST